MKCDLTIAQQFYEFGFWAAVVLTPIIVAYFIWKAISLHLKEQKAKEKP